MECIPVILDIKFSSDMCVDFFLLQWHTPPPSDVKIHHKIVQKRFEYLNAFKEWLLNKYIDKSRDRPVFIIAPELSLPVKCLDTLEEILVKLKRQAIIIAGLEYLYSGELKELIKRFTDMPGDAKSFYKKIEDGQKINSACILVKEKEKSPVRKFIQIKKYPATEEESLNIFTGDYILFFKSSSRKKDKRINFCVRICSDMTDEKKAEEFRKAIFTRAKGHIDFTFLLQMNKDQNADQFKSGIKGYFSQSSELIDTAKGCVIAVNNAIPEENNKKEYGRTRVYFKYDSFRLNDKSLCPQHTYWMEKDNTYGFQLAEFRESSEGIHLFSYKPIYLYSRHPGDTNYSSLPLGKAKFAYFNKRNNEGKLELEFKPIPAISSWLDEEWKNGINIFIKSMEDSHKKKTYIEKLKEEYLSSLLEKKSKFIDDALLLQSMRVYTIACKKYNYCNDNDKNIHEVIEPVKWCKGMSDSAKCLLRSYTLLKIAESAFPEGNISLDFTTNSHAKYGNGNCIVFLWGCSNKDFGKVFTCFTNFIKENKFLNLSDNILLVFNKIDSELSQNEYKDYIKRKIDEYSKEIIKSSSYNIEGINDKYRTNRNDNIYEQNVNFSCILENWLAQYVFTLDSFSELKEKLEKVVKEAIE